MGSPYRGTGQALNPLPSRERRFGPECSRGVTLTPSRSRRGTTMWRTENGGWMGSPRHRVLGVLVLLGAGGPRSWPLCPGSHLWPVESHRLKEQRGHMGRPAAQTFRVPRRIEGTGQAPFARERRFGRCVRGSHPHPIPLPSRERGLDVTLTPYRGTGQALNPLPSRERGPEAAGDGFPLKAGTTMWRTGTAVGWGRLVRRPGCPGLAG